MKKRSGEKIKLLSVDELLGVPSGDPVTEIDVDKIYREFKKQASKTDITLNIPMLGELTLNERDLDKLYNYIIALLNNCAVLKRLLIQKYRLGLYL